MDVLLVGGGPASLVTGYMLLRSGVSTLVVGARTYISLSSYYNDLMAFDDRAIR